MFNYYPIIQKYFSPDSLGYQSYVNHVVQVTARALRIARRLQLNNDQLQFIEEAGMLHDIGVSQVHAPDIGCHGTAQYIQHGVLGRKILEQEGLTAHALVSERHTGVGLTKEEVIEQELPLPHRDFVPLSIEEKIICYADTWHSKNPEKIWVPYTKDQIHDWFRRFPSSDRKIHQFDEWYQEFGE